jgi:hypothetical protein
LAVGLVVGPDGEADPDRTVRVGSTTGSAAGDERPVVNLATVFGRTRQPISRRSAVILGDPYVP